MFIQLIYSILMPNEDFMAIKRFVRTHKQLTHTYQCIYVYIHINILYIFIYKLFIIVLNFWRVLLAV